MVNHEDKLGIVPAQPEDACSPLLSSTDMLGKAVLVKRGGCAFHTKANEVERAGGRVMVMGNHHHDPYILRMVREFKFPKSHNCILSCVVISSRVTAECEVRLEQMELSLKCK